MMDFMFRDPLRAVKFLDLDQFPYERGKDEIELDFMIKGGVYGLLLVGGGLFMAEGGWVVYVLWLGVNFVRRKGS